MVLTYLPLRRAATLGVAAYLVGYLVTFAVSGGQNEALMGMIVHGETVDSIPLGEILVDPPPRWVVAGWLFFNAQLIPTSLPAADAIGGFAAFESRFIILALDGLLPLLFLVPVACLAGAGYLTVRTGSIYGARGAIWGGAGVAAGYWPLLVIGSFGFFSDVPGVDMLVTPAFLPSVFVGLAYSLMAGAIGGWLAATTDDDRERIGTGY